MAEPSSLVLKAEPRKTATPLAILLVLLIGMLGLPIWLASTAEVSLLPFVGRLLTASLTSIIAVCLYAAQVFLLAFLAFNLTRQLAAKPTITLTTAGFEVRDHSGRVFTRWADVDSFDVAWDRSSRREFVGWRYKPNAGPTQPRWQGRPYGNLDATVGMGWEGSVSNLRDTLDQWRAKHCGS